MSENRKFEVKMLVDGVEKDSPIPHAWACFLNGHWQREMPAKPGKYMVGNEQGRVLGEVFVFHQGGELVVQVRDGAFCKLRNLRGTYFWWSARMPAIMPQRVPNMMTLEEAVQKNKKPPLKLVVSNS